jgi:hypothetical protein
LGKEGSRRIEPSDDLIHVGSCVETLTSFTFLSPLTDYMNKAGRTSRNWAGKSAEVLIEDFIPPEAIDLIFTPD